MTRCAASRRSAWWPTWGCWWSGATCRAARWPTSWPRPGPRPGNSRMARSAPGPGRTFVPRWSHLPRGFQCLLVPFNGSAPNLTALMGGQVQLALDTVVASTPLIEAGKIKPIATLGSQRLLRLPQVPTVAESGYPGLEMSAWFLFVGPADLPAPVLGKLEKALADTMASAALKKKMQDLGLTPAWGNGAALRERVQRELPMMRAVAARAGIRED